jgi:phosphoribosylformylglycinamidine (FGAM) synthase-like enzyme
VGVLGLIDRLDRPPAGVRLVEGGTLLALGPEPRSVAGSRWAWERGWKAGAAPALDLAAHAALAEVVRTLAAGEGVAGIHDASDGIGVALAEMAVASGVGCSVAADDADHRWLFAESASRVVVCAAPGAADAVEVAAVQAGVAVTRIGTAGGDRLVVEGLLDVPLPEVVAAWRGRLPDALGAGTSH